MTHHFAEIMFTPRVKELQTAYGSRGSYERLEAQADGSPERLTDKEAVFLAQRDSFYMATVSENGWPYVQHRGGPAGFLKVLDEHTLGFADFRGNKQFVSVGNLGHDGRVSIILVDYPNRRRLKVLGRARVADTTTEPDLIAKLQLGDYNARIERAVVITVEAVEWNCPQHITPRFTEAEITALVGPQVEQLKARIAALEAENVSLRGSMNSHPT
ncbi:MAG: pyridoxamine 5-phosphate oxidase [Rhodospirillaceae bacterium]|nr:pyridoxamine 5-phosphate oxidase [Rhodospirillaceae bacterium]